MIFSQTSRVNHKIYFYLFLRFSAQVIFSQTSELERQSSFASSTEEVSGQGEDRTPADDITSSENQFAVFKDFDFLEYELESQGVSGKYFILFLIKKCLLTYNLT